MNSSTGWLFCERLASRGAKAGVATCCSCGILRVASTRSLSAPRRRHERAQVVDRRPRGRDERAQLAQERREVLRRGLGLVDEHVEVVERRAQVHERRVGAPQRRRQQPERLRERDVLRRRSRPPSRSCCRRAPERSSRRSASAVTEPRGVDDEARQRPSSCVSWPTSRREVERNGLKYLAARRPAAPLPVVLGREALDDVLRGRRASLASSVLKIWSRSTTPSSSRWRASRRRRAPSACSGPGVSAM